MRKVCVLTTTRADYGIYYWMLKELQSRSDIKLQLVVSGTHLEKDYGYTIDEIRRDGFEISKEFKIFDSENKSESSVAKGISQIQWEFFNALASLKPDLVVLLGDRYEMAAAALATVAARLPIVHLYGGEITKGAVDDSLRHAITKLSFYHMTSAEGYSRRVIQMGETPDRVFTVGALGLDHLIKSNLPTQKELEEFVGFSLEKPTALVTYHPTTISEESPAYQISELLSALGEFRELQVIITLPNADWGRWDIVKQIDEWQKVNQIRCRVFQTMGHLRYLAAMKYAVCVVGNSSSGIIEAPSLGTPTLNIGNRQEGRIQASSIKNCGSSRSQIVKGLKEILEFKNKKIKTMNPYGNGHSAKNIVDILGSLKIPATLAKEFYEELA